MTISANCVTEYQLGADIIHLARKYHKSKHTIRVGLVERGIRIRPKGIRLDTDKQSFLITLWCADRARCAKCGWQYRVHGNGHDFVWNEIKERSWGHEPGCESRV